MLPGCLAWNHNEFIDRNCENIETPIMFICAFKAYSLHSEMEKCLRKVGKWSTLVRPRKTLVKHVGNMSRSECRWLSRWMSNHYYLHLKAVFGTRLICYFKICIIYKTWNDVSIRRKLQCTSSGPQGTGPLWPGPVRSGQVRGVESVKYKNDTEYINRYDLKWVWPIKYIIITYK